MNTEKRLGVYFFLFIHLRKKGMLECLPYQPSSCLQALQSC